MKLSNKKRNIKKTKRKTRKNTKRKTRKTKKTKRKTRKNRKIHGGVNYYSANIRRTITSGLTGNDRTRQALHFAPHGIGHYIRNNHMNLTDRNIIERIIESANDFFYNNEVPLPINYQNLIITLCDPNIRKYLVASWLTEILDQDQEFFNKYCSSKKKTTKKTKKKRKRSPSNSPNNRSSKKRIIYGGNKVNCMKMAKKYCKNCNKIVMGKRTMKEVELQLLDCLLCKDCNKKIYNKYKDPAHNDKIKSLIRKEKRILKLLLDHGYKVPHWLWKELN